MQSSRRTSSETDRRVAPRYKSVPNSATLAWWDDADEVSGAACVLDVSVNGVLLETKKQPALRQQVWVRLDAPITTEWYEATVARLPQRDQCALMFPDGCPYDLFKAMRGIRSEVKEQAGFGEEFDERYWR